MVLARLTGFRSVGILFDLAFFVYALYALSEAPQSPWRIMFALFTAFMVYADIQYIRTGKSMYDVW